MGSLRSTRTAPSSRGASPARRVRPPRPCDPGCRRGPRAARHPLRRWPRRPRGGSRRRSTGRAGGRRRSRSRPRTRRTAGRCPARPASSRRGSAPAARCRGRRRPRVDRADPLPRAFDAPAHRRVENAAAGHLETRTRPGRGSRRSAGPRRSGRVPPAAPARAAGSWCRRASAPGSLLRAGIRRSGFLPLDPACGGAHPKAARCRGRNRLDLAGGTWASLSSGPGDGGPRGGRP